MSKSERELQSVDVLVIGGGPAGLQATLTVGRLHRDVMLVDSGEPRNAPAEHMHNFITRDGTPPAEFRAAARAELAEYDSVQVRDGRVERLTEGVSEFTAELDDGTLIQAKRVILATGMRDSLPAIDGVADLFGSLIHHCPFCHGHEMAGKRVAILESPRTGHLLPMLDPIAAEIVVVSDPSAVRETEDGRLFIEGPDETVDGLFVPTELSPSARFAEQLGLEQNPSGAIAIDLFGRTTNPRVFAAGDGAHRRELPQPNQAVIAAAAAGATAGGSTIASLLF